MEMDKMIPDMCMINLPQSDILTDVNGKLNLRQIEMGG
jgi:hypothetical protein